MIRQYSRCCKSEYKKKKAVGSGIWKMPSSTDQEEGSTNQDMNLQNLIKAQ